MTVLNLCRKRCLAPVFALAITSGACAADLPFKMPVVAPVPAFSWTGVYLEIGGGTGWGNNEYTWNGDGRARCGRGPDAKPWNAAAAWCDPRIAPDQWRAFRSPTRRKLAGRAGRFRPSKTDAHWADIEGHGSCFDAGAVVPPRVSALVAMIRFRASAPSRVVSAQQLITR